MSSKAVAVAVFRALLRECREYQRTGVSLQPRRPVLEGWGTSGPAPPGNATSREVLVRALPFLAGREVPCPLPSDRLRQLLTAEFQAQRKATPEQATVLLDQGLALLRFLGEQRHLSQCSSESNAHGLTVQVTTGFNGVKDSSPNSRLHVFSYRVRISNNRPKDVVRVLGRQLRFQDATGRLVVEVPLGKNGVVGKTPCLPPGECFEYVSGVELPTPSGTAEGALLVAELASDGGMGPESVSEEFIMPLPVFRFHATL